MLRESQQHGDLGSMQRDAGGPAGLQEPLPGHTIADPLPTRPAGPLTVSALQDSLKVISAADDAEQGREHGHHAFVVIIALSMGPALRCRGDDAI